MDIFINECSLHEQFVEHADFEVALRVFLRLLSTIRSKKNLEYKLYQRSDLVLVYKAVRSRELVASLNALRDKSLNTAINVFYDRLNIRDWTQEKVHSSNDVFICDEEIVTDTCMAELAERLHCQVIKGGLLINFPESKFAYSSSVDVEKNEEFSIRLDCTDNHSTLINWLEAHFQISQFEYDLSSHVPPIDSQTVLRNKQRFERTRLPRQGERALYKERDTGHIWYVDNLHYGASSHIEVFDSAGFHIGEADLTGNIDRSKRDPNKKIDI